MSDYFRPILQNDPASGPHMVYFAGTTLWFEMFEVMGRGRSGELVPLSEVPSQVIENLSMPRGKLGGQNLHLMGVLNATPDSFSDGGHLSFDGRVSSDLVAARAAQICKDGATILDIGGESTRPGAELVPAEVEIARIQAPIRTLRAAHPDVLISVDTRKADVAKAAILAGASMINDVSALQFDADMAPLAAATGMPVCLMHAQGDPATMQEAPHYDDVLLDVFDHLETQLHEALRAGIKREQIILDPGIGFGKTQAHNMALLRRIALFHTLGCPLLLGVSRKGFIGKIACQPEPAKRGPGSVAVALHLLNQGVQIIRAHDIAIHSQAFKLWGALSQ